MKHSNSTSGLEFVKPQNVRRLGSISIAHAQK